MHNKAGFFALALSVALAAALAAAAVARPPYDDGSAAVVPRPVLMSYPTGHRKHKANPRLTRRYRRAAWHWETVMGRRHTHFVLPVHTPGALVFWRKRAKTVRRQAISVPHRSAWLCIHRYEGRWSDDDDPYWGGLQMDRSFMVHYAPRVLLRRGWANRWTPLEQMWVAERAYRSGRGFYPWSHTARNCGLI